MDFSQAPPQSPNKLTRLRDQLFKKHLIVSIPIVACIFVGFVLISFVFDVNVEKRLLEIEYPAEFVLPDLMEVYFNKTVLHMEFLTSLILGLHEGNALIKNGSMSSSNSNAACVIDEQQLCAYNFARLLNFISYYQSIPELKLTIDSVFLCTKNGKNCIGTRSSDSPLPSHQLAFLSQISVNISNPSSSPQLSIYSGSTERIYMAAEISRSLQHSMDINTVIIIKLHSMNSTISQILDSTIKQDISYFEVTMTVPHHIVYFQLQLVTSCVLCSRFSVKQTVDFYYAPKFSPLDSVSYQSYAGIGKLIKFLSFDVTYQRYKYSMRYTKYVSCLVPLIFLIFIFKQRQSITNWVHSNFSRKTLINQLYKYTIQDIFMGVKPSISNILQRGPSAQLFKCLSQLVDKNITPIQPEPEAHIHKEPFKFNNKISEIIQKYKQSVQPLMQAKNKNILAYRFNIQTYINDLCESEAKIIKQYYVRAQQLGILKQFFRFAYLAILKPVDEYANFMNESEIPLPKKLQQLFIRVNQSIHRVDVIRQRIQSRQNDHQQPQPPKKVQKNDEQNHAAIESIQFVNLSCSEMPIPSSHQQIQPAAEEQPYLQENKQQLQMRIRVHIIPKYLTILRDLDSRSNYTEQDESKRSMEDDQRSYCTYAQILNLDKQLRSLGEIIQNTRYLLTKHNKTIRMFNK